VIAAATHSPSAAQQRRTIPPSIAARPFAIPSVLTRRISIECHTRSVGETQMIANPRREPQQDEGDGDKRLRQEEALDEALKNTFPASDPVSVEQPTTTGRARRP